MKYSAWIGLVASVLVIIVCFTTWVYVPAVHLSIGGMSSSGEQNFGKPGLINLFCTSAAIVFFLLPMVWAKRTNIFFCGFNVAWAVRNYILLSRCYGGDCPVKKNSLYILLFASTIMLIMSFIPDVKIKEETSVQQ